MDSDSALRLLGRYSRWQIRSYLCCASAFGVAFSWILMTVVFIGDTPNYRCALPPNGSAEYWIPQVEKNGHFEYDKCSMYVDPSIDNMTVPCQYGYWYDPESGYDSTISMQWDLVCDRAWLVELSMSMQAAGKMIGALVFNHLSDKYGRKMVFLSCFWANVVVASTRAFSPNMVMYSLLVFLGGTVQQGFVSASFVMAVELFPTDQRSTAGTVIEMFWAAGYMTVGGMAYFIRNWRYLELITALPFIMSISYYWILSESIPWLVANNKFEEADAVMRKAAKINKITLPDTIFKRHPTPLKDWMGHFTTTSNVRVPHEDETKSALLVIPLSCQPNGRSAMVTSGSATDDYKPVDEGRHSEESDDAHSCTTKSLSSDDAAQASNDEDHVTDKHSHSRTTESDVQSDDSGAIKYGLRDIFHSKTMLLYASVLVFMWFVLCLSYNAMGIMVTYLPGDRYLNFFLYAVMEIPAYLLTWLLAVRASRRISLMALCMTGGLLLLTASIMDTYDTAKKYWILLVAFNVMGKFMMTCGLSLVYVIVPEIFPTNMRNVGMGLCQMFGRFGAFLGPFARVLHREIAWMPSLIMAIFCLVGSLVTLLLPETRLQPLPDTIGQVEALRKKSKPNTCCNDDAEQNSISSNNAEA